MKRQWLILSLVIFMYLPVSIDATVLHIAMPILSQVLNTSANELLWIIDIYSLTMAGFLLPMGALGDRIGFKRLSIIGLSIFGLASLLAALSQTAPLLIIARMIMGLGASMILPATLSAIRITFEDDKQRNMALGVWASIGVGGAAFGPLMGGYLLEHFYWGSVFLINIPIVLGVLIALTVSIPAQRQNRQQQWGIGRALLLTSALLILVYTLKTGLRGESPLPIVLGTGFLGLIGLWLFIRQERKSPSPMIDFQLLKKRVIAIGVIMAMTSMIVIVGFELFMVQELQFVYQMKPLEAGIFMLPLMLCSGLSGPIAGWLVGKVGLRIVATAGIGLSAFAFLALASFEFMNYPYLTWALIGLLGFSAGSALLASTTAIMTATPANKSSSAGAIESMAYELGAGFGVVIFGLMLTRVFTHQMILPEGIPAEYLVKASSSISEAFFVAKLLPPALGEALILSANSAFMDTRIVVLGVAGITLLLLSAVIWRLLPRQVANNE